MIKVSQQLFQTITLYALGFIILLLFSLKLNSCQIGNDISTTKKNTKTIDNKIVTEDRLNEKFQSAQDSFNLKDAENKKRIEQLRRQQNTTQEKLNAIENGVKNIKKDK